MKTPQTSKQSKNSHNNSTLSIPALSTTNPSVQVSVNPSPQAAIDPPIPGRAADFPQSILKRKFRALSFGSQLTETQRAVLSTWLTNEEYSVEDIRKRIAAPPPDGFGMEVNSTTLFRLRKLADNTRAATWISDAMDTACDILGDEDVGENAPIHQALTSLLYSRALHAAQKQAMPETIDKIVTTIAKLEKLKTGRLSGSSPHPSIHRSNNPPVTTRHRVELSIIPASSGPTPNAPKIVEISATPRTCTDSLIHSLALSLV